MSRIARVLVDSPLPQLDRLLDYRVPDTLEGSEDLVPGVRVSVPLRSAKRLATGFVVELADVQEFPGPISDVAALVSPVPVLQPEVWALARAVADRAAGSANDVLRLAIPKRQVRVEKAWLAQRDAASHGAGTRPIAGALSVTGYGVGAVEGVVASQRRAALAAIPGVVALPTGQWVGRWAVTLVESASHALAAGESAIVIVPDQRDQEQVLAAAEALLAVPEGSPAPVIRWDARQSAPDRYRGLLRAIDGPALIVGNRSAIYAPAAQLGLIALWNDGDPVLAEPLAPYVHARDAALVRSQQQSAALLLAGHTRTAEVERLVEIGWLDVLAPERAHRPRVVLTATQNADEPLAAMARIPSFAWRTAREALSTGSVLIQVSRPGADGAGADRTAHDLGRAFPGVRVVVADGERPLFTIDDRKPALVIATRGAEPIAPGGYRAVLLLDGERMLMRESLRVAEDVLRWWADAASLAADDGTVVLTGVTGSLANALASWQLPAAAAAELADRRALRFPPACRIAVLDGLPDAVDAALRSVIEASNGTAEQVGPLLPVSSSPERVRAIVRFDYAHGAAVATAARAELIRQATTRRKPIPGQPPRGRQQLPLRLHFDDADAFTQDVAY